VATLGSIRDETTWGSNVVHRHVEVEKDTPIKEEDEARAEAKL
jgi:hypothetical protein